MLEKVVVKTSEIKIFTCLIKCLIAGCLWTSLRSISIHKYHWLYPDFKIASLLLSFLDWFGLRVMYSILSLLCCICVGSFVYCPRTCLVLLRIACLSLLSWRQGMKCLRAFSLLWFFFFFAWWKKTQAFHSSKRYRLKTIFVIHWNEFTRFISATYVQIVKF